MVTTLGETAVSLFLLFVLLVVDLPHREGYSLYVKLCTSILNV